jgi:cysteine desulfurase/selenocysteine lyase
MKPLTTPETIPHRNDFPILDTEVQGHPLVYLDNAATTQKPSVVIEAVSRFYERENANIHRGVHYLSVQATDAYDRARETVARRIGAFEPAEVVFVRGTTEAINLVARSYLAPQLEAGDEILLTVMEHHANIVPWQRVAEETGARIVATPLTEAGEIDLAAFRELMNERTKMVAFTHVSNALGTINPVAEMVAIAKERGLPVLIDGAQGVAHGPVDVAALGCDFYAFSGHKVYGPDGIGVLWGKKRLLDAMPPYQSGGDMVERVTFERTTYKRPPERFEAGTPNISGAIGLAVAFDFLRDEVGWQRITLWEDTLRVAAEAVLGAIPGLTIHGRGAHRRASVVSFTLDGVHPHDLGTILDSEGIAIRAGNHCAQPLMKVLGVAGTARASFAFYNSLEEVQKLAAAVLRARGMFA